MLWNLPSFSFLKKVSGIQTFLASVIVKYFIRPKNIYDINDINPIIGGERSVQHHPICKLVLEASKWPPTTPKFYDILTVGEPFKKYSIN